MLITLTKIELDYNEIPYKSPNANLKFTFMTFEFYRLVLSYISSVNSFDNTCNRDEIGSVRYVEMISQAYKGVFNMSLKYYLWF